MYPHGSQTTSNQHIFASQLSDLMTSMLRRPYNPVIVGMNYAEERDSYGVAEDLRLREIMRFVLRSKIHRATVTHADIDYVGSISIDEDLLNAAGIEEWEKIHVLDVTNGSRLETYVVKAPAGSGHICINGAAAHLVQPGNLVILITYQSISSEDISEHKPTIVHVNTHNEVVEIAQQLEALEYIEC